MAITKVGVFEASSTSDFGEESLHRVNRLSRFAPPQSTTTRAFNMHVETTMFEPSDWVPNNQRLPVLLYKGLVDDDGPCDFEERFAASGWTGIWTNGVFDYQHYHAGAHEALGVSRGSATLLIGGPSGQAMKVMAGDCLVLPAGIGHQNLGCTSDFQVVGAYPKGQHADIQTSAASSGMLAKIASIPLPHSDPVQGPSGFLTKRWR